MTLPWEMAMIHSFCVKWQERLAKYGLLIFRSRKKKATKERLEKHGLLAKAELILDSHTQMEQYVKPDSVDGIYFNFGYLPGGDHELATKADTSVQAVETGMRLLKPGGVMALCIYSGGDTGFEEKNQILDFLRKLDSRKYIVIVNHYYNRENNPPIPAFVVKKG